MITLDKLDWFYNTTSGCGREICFYDKSKFSEEGAFGNEIAIYPADIDITLEDYLEWLKRDGILEESK